MFLNRRLFVLTGIILFSVLRGWAQPCLTGWAYRAPVFLQNSGGLLHDFQVNLKVNTQNLIANGKAKLDGSDIRFLSKTGAVLPFWIENGTYNTQNTSIWVKLASIPANQSDTIYLFYGEPGAVSIANGSQTFELFDDFNGATVNSTLWDPCNNATINVDGGNITFSSNLPASTRSTITSKKIFNEPVLVESFVESVKQGKSFLGFVNEQKQGYSMVYEDTQQPLVHMQKILPDTNCFSLNIVNPAQNAARSANTTQGIWKFFWQLANQTYIWPGAIGPENREDIQVSYTNNVSVALGNLDNNGSFKIDWIRVRKYAVSEPLATLGKESSIFVEAQGSSNSPVCEGASLLLSTKSIQGAIYAWGGPGNFSSRERNPTIPNTIPTQSGNYIVTVKFPVGCFSSTDTIQVRIDATTLSGEVSGIREVCKTKNEGTIELKGNLGTVQRWESSYTGNTPWNTIDTVSTVLPFAHLLNTTYYRSVIKNGVCELRYSNSVKITVDEPIVGGVIHGSPEVCFGTNEGIVQLTDYSGSILNWQYKKEGSSGWVDITGTNYTQTYKNLKISTLYRAIVANGVCPEMYSDSVMVKVHPLPHVSFSAEPVCFGIKTTFINNSAVSSGNIQSYLWNFADGNSSVIKIPSHHFDKAGTYSVKLSTASDKGCVSSDSTSILVRALPVVDFSFKNVCDTFPATFHSQVSSNEQILAYKWSFGDNVSTESSDATHLFKSAGTYSVKLSASTVSGCQDSLNKEITVYPRAKLDFNADTVFLGQTTQFKNNSSISQGSLAYNWDFGDLTVASVVNPNHTYKQPGNFLIHLISVSSSQCKDTLTRNYFVKDQTVASFVVKNECLYDSVRFKNTSYVPGNDQVYSWDFGNGDTSHLQNPTYLYKIPGTYNVKLRVATGNGSKSEATKNVLIYALPVSKFVNSSVCDKDSVSFSNLSGIASGTAFYKWDFGDSTTSNAVNPRHLYAANGTYLVTLFSVSDKNCKDTATARITIHPKPQPSFNAASVCLGVPSTFQNTSQIAEGSIIEYLWDFGDRTNSIETSPVKQFGLPKTYNVTLKAKSDQGCQNAITDTVVVRDNPVAKFTKKDDCFGKQIEFKDVSNAKGYPLSYFWNFGDGRGTSILPNPTYLYALPGRYLVTMSVKSTTAGNCHDSTAQSLSVFKLPTITASKDVTISKGLSTELSATGGVTYTWNPSTGLDFQSIPNPISSPSETTLYTVLGKDENGCKGEDKVLVSVQNDFLLFPSNVITPDGNGQNDTWDIDNILAFPNAKVTVVDRWGKKILEKTGYINDWGATAGTDILPEGDCYYFITSPDSDKVYSGTITIIRGH